MGLARKPLFSFLFVLVLVNAPGLERFVSLSGGHVAPFTNWMTAATNIQVAIDATASGDTVTVTNGFYAEGGKVVSGDLTNRVALDKPILVRSVNGPNFTTIQGVWDSATTNGPGAVRCAWLTNGATLSGFTLRGGATRSSAILSGNSTNSGGAAWCASIGSVITNCVIAGNAAAYAGGGVFSNTVVNSTIIGNTVGTSGGGAYAATLKNCALGGNRVNSATGFGGGAYNGALTNCTVAGNAANSGGGVYGGSTTLVINSILWNNSSSTSGSNYSGSLTVRYSCSAPIPTGTGNISSDPQWFVDGVHLTAGSPCRGVGNALYATGSDMDGQSWSNPPSMGCDEWIAAPTMIAPPKVTPGPQGQLQISTLPAAGQEPMAYSWLRDGASFAGGHYGGAESTRLLINNFGPQEVGGYQIIASNAFGMATSAVAQVTVHCVNIAGASPAEPYADWTTAATNIQTAIDATAIGDIVLVTNGVYDSGGKVKSGDLTNRMALDKALIVMSVNGAANTFIVGAPGHGGVNSSTAPNGTNATRCAWLADGAILSGFTLQGGGTRISTTASGAATNSGGGVWCASQSSLVTYCTISENSAYYEGGGGYGGTLANCTIAANAAGKRSATQYNGESLGGGVYNGNLNNCLVRGNQSGGYGGGAYGGTLNNCTLINNRAESGPAFGGGGAHNSILRNSILWNNSFGSFGNADASGGNLQYCCSGNVVSGTGNITSNPLFLIDGFHLSSASPCRGAGSPAYTSGTDLDGQTWTNPPSMGCDEWRPEPLLLGFKIQANSWGQYDFATQVAGIESSPGYWFKDGSLLSGSSHFLGADSTHLTVKGLSTADTGVYQLVVSNAFGMTTSRVASVVVHFVNAGNLGATAPYTNWATAAGRIQDAIEAAAADAVLLVTNGIYNTGGKATDVFDVTNRVALDKPVTVVSVNGPFQTAIEGHWDPVSTNGPNAVRCALLSSNSSLAGFTLRNGAPRASGLGGGVLAYNDEMVASCVISNNRAGSGGGAAFGSYFNCWFINNSASSIGGAVYAGNLNNCTVVENSAGAYDGGVAFSKTTNCIVWYNSAPNSPDGVFSTIYNSCSPSIGISSGNITNNPQLVDGLHLAANSPCRGVGAVNLFSATDLDGDAWSSPPSMGCDEFPAAGAVGPLTVSIESARTTVVVNHPLTLIGRITGNVSSLEWNYGDGPVVTDAGYFTTHSWTSPGDYFVTLTAFNADNLPGVTTNVLIHVEPLLSPEIAPSLSGSATNFQIQFYGQAGINYWIEYATNLSSPTTWLTLKTLTSSGGEVQITDTAATNAARFYRVKAQ